MHEETRHERALIVDFGSQVTQLIARRLRESGVYCEIHPFNKVDAAFLERYDPKAIILSGGPASVTWEDTVDCRIASTSPSKRCSRGTVS